MSGSVVNINVNILHELELGDIEDFEELSGVPLASITRESGLPIKAVRALIYVLKRHDDPEYTFEDARHIKFHEMGDILNPTPAVLLGKLEQPATSKRRAKAS